MMARKGLKTAPICIGSNLCVAGDCPAAIQTLKYSEPFSYLQRRNIFESNQVLFSHPPVSPSDEQIDETAAQQIHETKSTKAGRGLIHGKGKSRTRLLA
jgi:hypothetical protein